MPRAHQRDAISAAVAGLANGRAGAPSAAAIVMATGTGKTLVALEVADELRCELVVIAAPSRALVDQLAAAAARTGEVLAVSSASTNDATTDTADVARFCAGVGRRTVVSTYRSLHVVADALDALGALADLLVCDEAHHTAGRAGRDHPAHAFPATRRLYMTATPRVYEHRQGDLEVLGMDDTSVFGPRVYDLPLDEAIAAGLVADYRVVVAAIPPPALDAAARAAPGADTRLLAGAVATCQAMATYGLRSALSFHSRVRRAREFAAMVGAVAAELPEGQRPDGPGFSAWLSGRTTPDQRRRVLDRLAAASAGTWGVAANARCLGEGVDVPALDAVVICDPKTSHLDVAQAVGRALRPGVGKVATVVLPVAVSADGDADSASVAVAGSVLRALRAHDRQLGRRLDAARRNAAREPVLPSFDHRVVLSVPPGVAADVAASLALQLVRQASSNFDEMLGVLDTYVAANGHALVPQATTWPGTDGEHVALGVWCSLQRTAYRRGRLALDREAALEALPGWSWDPLEDRFSLQLAALTDWVERNGELPQLKQVHNGVRVGQFINVVRIAYGHGDLDAGKAARLEAVPQWAWDPRSDQWNERYCSLTQFASRHGHARPGRATDEALSRWVTKQRSAQRAGTLDPARARRLEKLPGWVWHERDAAWEAGFEALRDWVNRHGYPPAQSQVAPCGTRIGAWAAKQRSRYRAGKLGTERSARLEALDGWEWEPRAARWPEAFARLEAFSEEHGHAMVPDGTVRDGFALGAWVTAQRLAHRRGELSGERTTQLESLPGWVWDGYEARRRRE